MSRSGREIRSRWEKLRQTPETDAGGQSRGSDQSRSHLKEKPAQIARTIERDLVQCRDSPLHPSLTLSVYDLYLIIGEEFSFN